jgi:hypothetical protein
MPSPLSDKSDCPHVRANFQHRRGRLAREGSDASPANADDLLQPVCVANKGGGGL